MGHFRESAESLQQHLDDVRAFFRDRLGEEPPQLPRAINVDSTYRGNVPIVGGDEDDDEQFIKSGRAGILWQALDLYKRS